MTEKQMKRLLSRKQEMQEQALASRMYVTKLEVELDLRKQLAKLDELRLKNFVDFYMSDK